MEISESIIAKANEILAETKDFKEDFEKERKFIFDLLNKETIGNIEALNIVEELYDRIYKLNEDSKKYNKIKSIVEKIREQHIRKLDGNETTIHDFIVRDKDNKIYDAYIRGSIVSFIAANKEKFAENVKIKVEETRNLDIENIMKIISDN